jgi:hypothetical protein
VTWSDAPSYKTTGDKTGSLCKAASNPVNFRAEDRRVAGNRPLDTDSGLAHFRVGTSCSDTWGHISKVSSKVS